MTALTYDIISRTVFSHEIETPAEVMGEAITTYFEALGRIDLWDVLPLPRWLPPPAFLRAKPAQQIFREEVGRLLERRRARIAAGGTTPNDLVTRPMQAHDPAAAPRAADAHYDETILTLRRPRQRPSRRAPYSWPSFEARLRAHLRMNLSLFLPEPIEPHDFRAAVRLVGLRFFVLRHHGE